MKKTFLMISAFALSCFFLSCSLSSSFKAKKDLKTPGAFGFSASALTLERGGMEIINLKLEGMEQNAADIVWHYDGKIIRAEADNCSAVITGLSEGSTVLRASAGALTASCLVTVRGKAKAAAAPNPYVYSSTELLVVEAGKEKRVTVSLAGLPELDPDAFTFRIDKPSVASLSPLGNYCVIKGGEEGVARVTANHAKAAFPYSFLVSTQKGSAPLPYLSTESRIAILNFDEKNEETLKVTMANPPSGLAEGRLWEREIRWEVEGASVEAGPAGASCLIRAQAAGDSIVRASHHALPYPLEFFVRVIQKIDGAYIEASPPILNVRGDKAEVLSVSFQGLKAGLEADPSQFSWELSEGAADILDFKIYGSEARFSGKKSGAVRLRISHPLASLPCEAAILVSDTNAEAARASISLSTQNPFISLAPGGAQPVAVAINGLKGGEEARLSWSVASFPLDGGSLPVLRSLGATGEVAGRDAERPAERPAQRFSASLEGRDIARGGALFEGLRAGRAEIIVRHPRALYPLKILIHVEDAAAQRSARSSSFPSAQAAQQKQKPYLATDSNVFILEEGKNREVTITPVGISPSAYKDLVWSSNNSAAVGVSANGASASLIPRAGEGSQGGQGEALITVSHPLAVNSLELYATVGDRFVYKNTETVLIATESAVLKTKIGSGETVLRAALAAGGGEGGQKEAAEGFRFRISSTETASVYSSPLGNACFIKPLKPGKAIITVSHDKAAFDREVLLIVDNAESGEGGLPFLSTDSPFLSLKAGENAVLNAQLNGEEGGGSAWAWTSDAPGIVEVLSFTGGTAMLRGHNAGSASLTVRHSAAPAALRIIANVTDGSGLRSPPFIALSSSVLNLAPGGTAELRAEIKGGGEKLPAGVEKGFNFRLSDSSLALLESAGGTAILRGLKTGTAYLSVSHPGCPPETERRAIVNIREKADEGCAIIVDEPILKLGAHDKKGGTLRASLAGAAQNEAFDARNFVFWLDDPGLVFLEAVNDTAVITGRGRAGATHLNISHPKAEAEARVLIMAGGGGDFGFESAEAVVREGGVAFIPLKPMSGGGEAKVLYSSNYGSICSAAGTERVAMLAGLKAGHAEITARLTAGNTVLSESRLAVIVERTAPESPSLKSPALIYTVDKGRSIRIPVTLSGRNVEANDRFGILWESSDKNEDFIRLRASGDGALVEALRKKGREMEQGEAVLTVRHPRYPGTALSIRIIVPGDAEKTVVLDQTELLMAREDGTAVINATIINGTSEDYASLSWSVSRTGSANTISISKGKGKQCVILPRQAGSALVSAALPTGEAAFCTVTVVESADIHFGAEALSVNPGYTEKFTYSVTPPGAHISWAAQDVPAVGKNPIFEYSVNEAEKTVSIRGKEPGKGSITAFFSGSSGAAMKKIDVAIEYNYKLEFKSRESIIREPAPGSKIEIPFTVFPHDLGVNFDDKAEGYDASAARFVSLTQDRSSGEGLLILEPLREAQDVRAVLTARGRDGEGREKTLKIEKKLSLRYAKTTPRLHFETAMGAYSRKEGETLVLGDGEAMLLAVDFAEANVEAGDLNLEWLPSSLSSDPDETSLIALEQEDARWRFSHTNDYVERGNYYFVEDDMLYHIYTNKIWYERYWNRHYKKSDEFRFYREIGTEMNEGVVSWQNEGKVLRAVSGDDRLTAALSAVELLDKISISGQQIVYNDGTDVYNYNYSEKLLPLLGSSSGFYNSLNPFASQFYMGKEGGNEKIEFFIATSRRNLSNAQYRYNQFIDRVSPSNVFSDELLSSGGYVEVVYRNRRAAGKKPFLIRKDVFERNPNWYRGRHDMWYVSVQPAILHQKVRTEVPQVLNVDATVRGNKGGTIKVSWTDAAGKRQAKEFAVRIEVRTNAAYSAQDWIQTGEGRWEPRN